MNIPVTADDIVVPKAELSSSKDYSSAKYLMVRTIWLV